MTATRRQIEADALRAAAVENWHTSDAPGELHEHLGMTWPEYSQWVEAREHPGIVCRSTPVLPLVTDERFTWRTFVAMLTVERVIPGALALVAILAFFAGAWLETR